MRRPGFLDRLRLEVLAVEALPSLIDEPEMVQSLPEFIAGDFDTEAVSNAHYPPPDRPLRTFGKSETKPVPDTPTSILAHLRPRELRTV